MSKNKKPSYTTKRMIQDMILQELYLIQSGVDPEDKFLRENDPPPEIEGSEFAATASEEAEKVNAQAGANEWGGTLVTDQEHWDAAGVHTGEDLARYLLVSTYSDLYKGIYGFRPRGMGFDKMSVPEINQIIDDLYEYGESMGEEDEEPPVPKTWNPPEAEAAPHSEFEEYEDLPKRSGIRRE